MDFNKSDSSASFDMVMVFLVPGAPVIIRILPCSIKLLSLFVLLIMLRGNSGKLSTRYFHWLSMIG
jgi:hypothetical protein